MAPKEQGSEREWGRLERTWSPWRRTSFPPTTPTPSSSSARLGTSRPRCASEDDEDGDGVAGEVTVAEISVLHVFDVTNPRPRLANLGPAAVAGFDPAPGGGVFVPLFADLKRHRMGPRLAETFEGGELANDEFTSRIRAVRLIV